MKHHLMTLAGFFIFTTAGLYLLKKLRLFLALPIAMLFLCTLSAEAANRYIRSGATGSANGSDWVNAYTTLPSSLVRGDTYYIADGNYGSYIFDDANSGSTLIIIKKATIADHGADTGWLDSYGDGQATFGNWTVTTDYWLFDGQMRNLNWRDGATNQYGFRVSNTNNTKTLRLDNGLGMGADHVTFRHIDFVAAGRDTGIGDDVVYGLFGHQNITFQNSSLRDSDRTIFLMRGCWQNLLVENSYLARNASSPAIHGELLSDTCSDNVVFRNNMIEDIEGTAVWAVLNGSGAAQTASNTASDWKIYGNVIHWTPGYNREGVAAIFMSANASTGIDPNRNWTDNLAFYNNTINDNGIYVIWYGLIIEAGTNNIVKNNIFYNLKNSDQVGVTADYNWYYLSPHPGDSGPNTKTCSSNCNIFTDRTNKFFTLSGNNLPAAGDNSIGSAFNTDPNGILRGVDGAWDRGAFEFTTGNIAKPAPPTGLRVQ